MKFTNRKHGISLIAVLMFMLAATTASVVVFRYLGEENFLSGARLKQSEAYQASESGLDVVQSWLTNRAVDAGDLVGQYVSSKNSRKSILMAGGEKSIDVLGKVGGSRSQNFTIYLTGVDENSKPMKLKFLSIGEGRDGSKVSQSAIFSLDGLYKTSMLAPRNAECTVDFKDAVFGKAGGGNQTQANWSNATVNNPDFVAKQIRTSGDFTATGNVTLTSGTFLGLDPTALANNTNTCPADLTKAGDSYIVGDLTGQAITSCGNMYVGGNVVTNGAMTVKGDLYVAGDLTLKGNLIVEGNLTIGGSFSNTTFNMTVGKDLLVLPKNNGTQTFQLSTNNSEIKGDVWISPNVVFEGGTSQFKFATNPGSKLYMDKISKKSNTECKYNNNDNIYFSSSKCNDAIPPNSGNQITGANDLERLKSRINTTTGKVEDPLELPEDMKIIWLGKAKKLLEDVNKINLVGSGDNAVPPPNGPLPAACVYLLKNEGTIPVNHYCRSIDKGGCTEAEFRTYLNTCYNELKTKECNSTNPTYLYRGGDECYLPIKFATNQSIVDGSQIIEGNFILIFDPKPSVLKLPSTTKESKVLVYLPEGAGEFAVSGNTDGNYFIFADKDIDKTTGDGRIKGTIFMANGSEIGEIQDSKITFNEELFQALLDAGILQSTNDPSNDNCKPESVNDDIYIPVSSRLSVKLENKEISKETAPEENGKSDLEKSILVMPRVVRLAKNEIKAQGDFRKFYTYMYLNGATLGDESKEEPTCKLMNSKNAVPPQLNTTGTPNAEGLYECKFNSGKDCRSGFNGTNVCHSDFYVRVAGDAGNPEISITPESETVSKDKIGTEAACITVKLQAEEANDAGWQVSVFRENGNNLWNVTPIINNNSPCTGDIISGWNCFIPEGKTSADILKVCPTEAEGDEHITLKIAHSEGGGYKIDEANSRSTISILSNTSLVQRDDPKFENENVDCPFKPNSWVSLTCPDKAVVLENKQWRCKADENAEWRVDEGDACEVTGSDNNAKYGTILVSTQENNNRFEVGLKWKSHKLRVSGLDNVVNITTSNPDVPANKRNLTCTGTTGCDIYHGATYKISRPGTPVQAICNAGFCPSYPIYLGVASGISLSGNLTPTGDVTIELRNIDNPVVLGCVLKEPQQKIGQGFYMNDIVNIIASDGYECNNEIIRYSILETTEYIDISKTQEVSLKRAGFYTVKINVTCNGLTSERECNEQLQGVSPKSD